MKTSYVAIGSSLSKFSRLLYDNHFRVHPKYFPRLILIYQSAIWTSIFNQVEKCKFRKRLRNCTTPDNPVFIIGHWRTGSTFLHQLMALDQTFVSPNVFQVTVPECFHSIEKYYKPVMGRMMDSTRPMDNVRFGPDAPQEDEFALLRMTLQSPLRYLLFPSGGRYFLLNDPGFIAGSGPSTQWKLAISSFYKKLSLMNGKRILIKNPFHSLRIKALYELFPKAVFIHIYRNPNDVVPSTIRMWDIIARQNCMNTKWEKPTIEDVAQFYERILKQIKEDGDILPAHRFIEIKYEELERTPVESIKNIYTHFNLNYTPEFEGNMNHFLQEVKNYKKNQHSLSAEERDKIRHVLSSFMSQHGYV